jgi:hypothetical protein
VADYAIQWDGKKVTLPPAGPVNPDGVAWAWIHDGDGNGIYDLRMARFADAAFAAHGKRVGSISVDVVLIPRPDNPFDSDAVSIALPAATGGDAEERCLGYLYRHTVENWGIANDERKDLVARLATFSEDGEVHFTAIMSRDNDPDEDHWDAAFRIPEFSLDLPKAPTMGCAIRDFLAEREKDQDSYDIEDLHRRVKTEELLKAGRAEIRWLQGLRAELVGRLADDVVTHSNGKNHPYLEVRRQRDFAVKVVNNDGGCVGLVRRDPELLVVGSEFDRPAVVDALARAGITVPFDPTPGWLNASLQPESGGWIHVVWVGRIAGLNVEPVLASFEIGTRDLHVFAQELAIPIERLLRRNGHAPEKVLLRDHPRDPFQFFGQDLIARLQNGTTARTLRPGARALIPDEWAEQIEARWRVKHDLSSRNTAISWQASHQVSPVNRRPPDNPELPPDLLQQLSRDDVDDRSPTGEGDCRLCGAPNQWGEPSPYCFDCVHDARTGLFVDLGFDGEAWHQAVIWSLNQLAVTEFGGAPAEDQLRKAPGAGPDRDLLMLCRMLTSREGLAAPGSHRKVYSWTDWLAEAGLLAGGIRTSRGVTVVAKDGHMCRSLLERHVDDFFFDNGIEHDIEPHYPFDPELNRNGSRADWRLADGTYVEALGFTADPTYMAKVERKLSLAARHRIPVVTVTQAELPSLPDIFARWLPTYPRRPRA